MFDDILNVMKSVAIFLSLVISSVWSPSPLHAAEQGVAVIGAEFWAMPRHADQLLAQTPLKAAAQQLWVESDAYLVLHYPSGESGEVWGLELQAWLVSLGIASDRIALRAGYERDEGVAVIMVTAAVPETEAGAETAAETEMDQIETQVVDQNSSEAGAAVVTPAAVQDKLEL